MLVTAGAERWERSPAPLDRILTEADHRRALARRDAAYEDRLARFVELFADALEGRPSAVLFQEAMSTSDFPLLMGDVLDRQLLARYREVPVSWPAYARRGVVRDFRQVRRVALDGAEGRFYPSFAKRELAGAQEQNDLTETGYTYAVEVYERAVSLNWRLLVNDDLDAFRDAPDRLARGARRTEEYLVTQLFVDANGPHGGFYSNANKNIINTANGATADNPPLSIAGLQDGMRVLGNMRDASGEPIAVDAVVLVVPPALEVTALNILNATQLWANAEGGTSGLRLITENWMRNRVRLVVNPYIPVVASAANGNTSWFLFADPNASRPALEVGFLRGFTEPQLYQQAPNTQRIGGDVDPLLGDFETQEIRYKGVHVLGGTRLDPRATVASNGSGA